MYSLHISSIIIMEQKKDPSMTLLVGVIALIDVSLLYMSCTQNQDIAGFEEGKCV